MKFKHRKIGHFATAALTASFVLFLNARVFAKGTSKVAGKYTVSIQDFSFQPETLNVPVGATVTWTNKDEEPHTVFSSDDVFKSKALDTDEKFSFTFERAGTYKYFCSVHPKMVATIVVGSSAKKSAPMKRGKMKEMN